MGWGIQLKIYLINLDRSPDRLDFMRSQFQNLNLDFERVPAIDGNDIDMSRYSQSPLRPPVIGCLLSHRLIWEKLIQSESEHALVFEDDVVISDTLPVLLADMSWMPENSKLIKLETVHSRVKMGRVINTTPDGRSVRRLLSNHHGTGSYIIHRSEAERLLKLTSDFQKPVDLVMFLAPTMSEGTYQLAPALAIQASLLPNDKRPNLCITISYEDDPDQKREITRSKRFVTETLRPFYQVFWRTRKILFPKGPIETKVRAE